MNIKIKKLLLVAILATGLASCGGHSLKKGEELPDVKVIEPSKELSTVRMLENAIVALQHGDEAKAVLLIKAIIKQNPDHATANWLLQQIEIEPDKYYSKNYFVHKVQHGESMASIVNHYFSNELEFYILARYNNIKNPSKLRVAQEIKIPKKRQGQHIPHFVNLRKKIKAAGEQCLSGDYQAGFDKLVDIDKVVKSERFFINHYSQCVFEYSQSLFKNAEYQKAVDLLSKVEAYGKVHKNILKDVKKLEKKLMAELAMQKADNIINSGSDEQILEALYQVLSIKPQHKKAKPIFAAMVMDVTQKMHRKALQLYRQQALDEAIAIWNKVLAYRPDFERAIHYRGVAIDLQKRLESFE